MKYSAGGGVRNTIGFIGIGVPLKADEVGVTFMGGVTF
jgi:hypothetical protein